MTLVRIVLQRMTSNNGCRISMKKRWFEYMSTKRTDLILCCPRIYFTNTSNETVGTTSHQESEMSQHASQHTDYVTAACEH